MSNARNDNDEKGKILPRPVTEDGMVDPVPSKSSVEDELDERDAGLTDVGGGDPEKRKII